MARFRNHGGLTPPAPAARRSIAGRKRLLRCTNAFSPNQERRTSARRGLPKRTCKGHTPTFTDARHTGQERRVSARRGLPKRTCRGDLANAPETVADAAARRCTGVTNHHGGLRRNAASPNRCKASALLRTTGGLRPPLLLLQKRLPACHLRFPLLGRFTTLPGHQFRTASGPFPAVGAWPTLPPTGKFPPEWRPPFCRDRWIGGGARL